MSKKENFSIALLVAPPYCGASDFSRPNPEEGHRLMRSFSSIRQPALREAIIELVTNLSALDGRKE
jgi:hypothetical protein